MQIEVVYALADEQEIIALNLPPDATVRDAVIQSELLQRYSAIVLEESPVGIYGERVSYDAILRDGDRVEIYRPLIIDPMEARRARARGQKKSTD